MLSCIDCGIENTSFLHNSGSMANYSVDKPSISCFTEHICPDFNLLSIIDHKYSIGFMSGLFSGQLSTFALAARNFGRVYFDM